MFSVKISISVRVCVCVCVCVDLTVADPQCEAAPAAADRRTYCRGGWEGGWATARLLEPGASAV